MMDLVHAMLAVAASSNIYEGRFSTNEEDHYFTFTMMNYWSGEEKDFNRYCEFGFEYYSKLGLKLAGTAQVDFRNSPDIPKTDIVLDGQDSVGGITLRYRKGKLASVERTGGTHPVIKERDGSYTAIQLLPDDRVKIVRRFHKYHGEVFENSESSPFVLDDGRVFGYRFEGKTLEVVNPDIPERYHHLR